MSDDPLSQNHLSSESGTAAPLPSASSIGEESPAGHVQHLGRQCHRTPDDSATLVGGQISPASPDVGIPTSADTGIPASDTCAKNAHTRRPRLDGRGQRVGSESGSFAEEIIPKPSKTGLSTPDLRVEEITFGADRPVSGPATISRSSDFSVKNEPRPDRGWQPIGEIARAIVKETVVKAALNGSISYGRADEIVGSDWLRGA